MGSTLTRFTRWLSVGATLAAVAAPGALAWALTFGRHLIPQEPREQVYMVRRAGNSISLTPVKGSGDGGGVAYAGSMLQRGMEMMAKKG